MKKITLFLAVSLFSGAVFASCPSWKPYGCIQLASGKMLCGCGVSH